MERSSKTTTNDTGHDRSSTHREVSRRHVRHRGVDGVVVTEGQCARAQVRVAVLQTSVKAVGAEGVCEVRSRLSRQSHAFIMQDALPESTLV